MGHDETVLTQGGIHRHRVAVDLLAGGTQLPPQVYQLHLQLCRALLQVLIDAAQVKISCHGIGGAVNSRCDSPGRRHVDMLLVGVAAKQHHATQRGKQQKHRPPAMAHEKVNETSHFVSGLPDQERELVDIFQGHGRAAGH